MYRRSSRGNVSLRVGLSCVLWVAACSGSIGDSDEPSAPDEAGGRAGSSGGTGQPGSGGGGGRSPAGGTGGSIVLPSCTQAPNAWPALRRLSTDELANTLRDLLALPDRPALELPADDQREGFANDAELLRASAAFVSSFELSISGLAEKAVTQRSRYLNCPVGKEDAACVRGFVESFGKRAFRRPLSTAEVNAFTGFFTKTKNEIDAEAALSLTLSAFLQSPEFVYRNEAGDKLDGYQLASRLSYSLWQSMPDDELFAKADDGSLEDPAVLRQQALRMLEDGKTRAGLSAFHRQWLSLDRVDTKTKDSALFPSWTPALAEAAREESERFAAHVLFDKGGSFRDLMTSRTAFVKGELAALYGLPSGGADWQEVELPASERAGILTRVAFQAGRGHSLNGSPILRGISVMERVVCEPVPKALDNVDTSNPAENNSSNKTNRQLFEERTAPQLCQNCHSTIDPFGFAFEAYDTAGQYRREEKGQVIDVSGTIKGTDVEGPYDGPVAFVEKLAGSAQAQRCYAGHWYQFLSGRPLTDADECRKDGLGKASAEGMSVLDLLDVIVSSPEFTSPGRTAP
ncbi:MAG: DUF1592 domain-containing protein [Myxococcales bacterium]|nr:DUF1592 domain-containing protein [Myxococcales bacterium]